MEAWSRDDKWVSDWYINNKFSIVDSYLQVFIEGENEMKQTLKSEIPEFYPVQAFAHYVGKEKEMIKNRYTI